MTLTCAELAQKISDETAELANYDNVIIPQKDAALHQAQDDLDWAEANCKSMQEGFNSMCITKGHPECQTWQAMYGVYAQENPSCCEVDPRGTHPNGVNVNGAVDHWWTRKNIWDTANTEHNSAHAARAALAAQLEQDQIEYEGRCS